ncbi:hypothetical protein C0216_00750 [Streptomyces globosus]|uniref:Nuclear transport factor 2 family protein n=1 Tax=Streptomyces globosus TaxID=68209 RepID=A0A344TU41_9ACTN|nr:hypothetical protein [Streptomyces globosus]AXE22162.1 hypothetical protein C0216_00750 [Streptomyces globosus]
MRLRGAGGAAACAALALAAATGCTSPESSASADGRPSAEAGLRNPDPEVRQAYDAYWAAWLTANRTPDPADPALERVATGTQLAELRENLAHSRTAGQVLLGEVGHRVEGVSDVGPGQLVLHDCIDLDRWLIHDARTGRPVDQLEDKPTQLGAFTLKREGEGGPWRVASLRVIGENC